MASTVAAGMTGEQRELLERIEAVELDQGGASLPFSARLARDNGWSAGYADRVVAEYRRFVFLAAVAGHPVTPSDEVDQAWHLHLVYTHSYWDDLCGSVLGFPLHHGPTVGGAAEGAKFTDWYERTLDSYRRLFGAEPPVDIWPPSRRRFADADRFRRINTADHWVVPKPRAGGRGAALAVSSMALTVTGCVAAAGGSTALVLATTGTDDEIQGDPVALVVVGVIVVAFFLFLARALWRARGAGGGSSAKRSGFFGGWSGGAGCGGGGCGHSGCGGGGCGGGGCGGCGS